MGVTGGVGAGLAGVVVGVDYRADLDRVSVEHGV